MSITTIKSRKEFLRFARTERIRISTNSDSSETVSNEQNIIRLDSSFADIMKILEDSLNALKARKDIDDSYERFFSYYHFSIHMHISECSELDYFGSLINDAKAEGIRISTHMYSECSELDSFISLISDVKAKGIQLNETILMWGSQDIGSLIKDLFVYTDTKEKIVADTIIFNTELDSTGEFIDITAIHKYLLFCCKFNNCFGEFRLYINSDDSQTMENGGNVYRLKALINNSVDFERIKIYKGEERIEMGDADNNKADVGMLPPAVYIGKDKDYDFLKCPLEKKIWECLIHKKSLIEEKKEQDNSGKEYSKSDENKAFDIVLNKVLTKEQQKFKPYLRLCQRFLFEEFDGNNSKEYTKLRNCAYSNDSFYIDYVSKIPFLALLLFALYDNHYRDENLRRFKDTLKAKQLKNEDFLLILQGKQKRDHYEKYKELKELNESYDIKNLVDFDDKDQIDFNNKTQPIKYQKTVAAEIFECVSIAEGLLQILENAVNHAGGGLLSMRIYNRADGIETHEPKKPRHVNYLNRVYGEDYFNFLSADFYLEIQLSDFSNMSMPEKYIDNMDEDTKEILQNKLSQSIKQYGGDIDKYLEDLSKEMGIKYFFSTHQTSKQLLELKKRYYEITDCIVHHYGLETFNAIVTARNGIFSVCGHENSYSNVEDIVENVFGDPERLVVSTRNEKDSRLISELKDSVKNFVEDKKKTLIKEIARELEKDKELPGTSYRLLVPLNHTRAIVYNSTEMLNEDSRDEENIVSVPIECKVEEVFILRDTNSTAQKQENINKFADHIEDSIKRENSASTDSIMLPCINIDKILAESEPSDMFETIIKGTLLAGLRMITNDDSVDDRPEYFPIAVINMTSFQFVEAARIIAIYYNKIAEQKDKYKGMHIYLKCKGEPKDMTFFGSDLQSIRDGMIRTAMQTGAMFDELDTIAFIFERLISPRLNYKREETNE